jgi:hypothetical protein
MEFGEKLKAIFQTEGMWMEIDGQSNFVLKMGYFSK